jgi:hypothetical protein
MWRLLVIRYVLTLGRAAIADMDGTVSAIVFTGLNLNQIDCFVLKKPSLNSW